jgi:hypothetical protein
MFAFGETVVRVEAARVLDPYSGEETALDWANPVETPIQGCAVYPGASDETISVGRDQASETLTVLLPRGTPLDYQDRMVIRGKTYEVSGFPHDYHHPITGWEPGVAVTVTRQEG